MGVPGIRWGEYLDRYHAQNAGITERVLSESTAPGLGTPYAWLAAALPHQPGDVIDLACGSAPLHPHLVHATSYIGVDRSAAELELAARLGRGPLVCADVLDLPLPDASADVVLCSMAVMLFQSIEGSLDEIARVLRPGGLFATIRPAAGPVTVRDVSVGLTLIRGLHRFPQMPQRFSVRHFRRLLSGAGLAVVDDVAQRFAHPLEGLDDARLAVDALYLPDVDDARRQAAGHRLARRVRAGRQFPVAIRRTVARRG